MINRVIGHSRSVAATAHVTWKGVLALTFAWGCLPAVRAADYWVATGGRDATGWGSSTRPWATLQYAANQIRPGDTVHVRDGEYEGFDLRRGGTREALVCFKAEGKTVRIVRRNRKTPDGINVEGAGYVIIEGFVVNEMPRAGVRGALSPHLTIRLIHADRNGSWGILTGFCDDVMVVNNVVSNCVREHGIYVGNSGDRPIIRGNVSKGNRSCGIHINGDQSQGGDGIISGAVVENNLIYGNGRAGGSAINCDGVQDSTIRNNLLYDNHKSGISLYREDGAAGSKSNRVINNTIVMPRSARWAVNIKDGSTGNVVRNNILFHEDRSRGSINIDAGSLPGFQSDFNIVVDRFSPDDGDQVMSLSRWQSTTGLDRHSIVATPQRVFVSPDASDFRLKDDSPAIDAADPSVAPPHDLEGRPRPVGSRPDIGAFENQSNLEPGR
jgi:parallel beta-helix repeat protein